MFPILLKIIKYNYNKSNTTLSSPDNFNQQILGKKLIAIILIVQLQYRWFFPLVILTVRSVVSALLYFSGNKFSNYLLNWWDYCLIINGMIRAFNHISFRIAGKTGNFWKSCGNLLSKCFNSKAFTGKMTG